MTAPTPASSAPFNSGAPICLVAYGKNNVSALQKSGLGYTIVLNPFYRS